MVSMTQGGAAGFRAFIVMVVAAAVAPAFAQLPQPPKPMTKPLMPAAASAGTAAVVQPAMTGKVLLIDDDESDNNNIAGDPRLSKSDQFYRHLLEQKSLAYDAVVVPRYANGPTLEQLRPYRLILWYTGASYGGNRDNTSVVSVKDEDTLRQYLGTGGSVIVVSPGYLNNVLGAGGAALWAKKESPFLKEVLGIQGGRGLLERGKQGAVAGADGSSYPLTAGPTVEVQLSAANPATASPLFTAQLNPDGTGARAVAVATSNAVGSAHIVYVGFTFEDIGGDTAAAFGQMLQAAAPAAPRGNPSAIPAATQVAEEPKWPVNFELLPRERAGWGFVVGQPGAISVRVQSQGAPVVVSVRKPDGTSVERSGNGDVTVAIEATAADVARSVLWGVSVRDSAAPAAISPTGGTAGLLPVAKGTVAVVHPAADAQRTAGEIRAFAAKRAMLGSPLDRATSLATRTSASAGGAAVAKVPNQAGAAQLGASAGATAAQALASRLATVPRTRGAPIIKSVSPSSAGAGALVDISGSNFGPGFDDVYCRENEEVPSSNPFGMVMFVIPGATGGETIGDYSYFGNCAAYLNNLDPGAMHFNIRWSDSTIRVRVPDLGLKSDNSTVGFTTDIQIYVRTAHQTDSTGKDVPDLTSAPVAYRYVVPPNAAAAPLVPSTAYYWLFGVAPSVGWGTTFQMNHRLVGPAAELTQGQLWGLSHATTWPIGARGDDEFSLAGPLQNGWVVEKCELFSSVSAYRGDLQPTGDLSYPVFPGEDDFTIPGNTWHDWLTLRTIAYHTTSEAGDGPWIQTGPLGEGANAQIVECAVDTASPYVKVHWWAEAGAAVQYNVAVKIHGPSGARIR